MSITHKQFKKMLQTPPCGQKDFLDAVDALADVFSKYCDPSTIMEGYKPSQKEMAIAISRVWFSDQMSRLANCENIRPKVIS